MSTQPMSPRPNERGTALIAVLSIVMILLPLGAFVVFQCRTDFAIQRNLRAELEAFYVAEAGLEHAIADIRPGQSFDDILRGPDRIASTADDGVFPFREGPPGDFPAPPFRYAVSVTRGTNGMLHILSRGSGVNGASKMVEALVTRSRLAFTPAALHSDAAVVEVDLGSAGFLVSGFDHRRTDAPHEATGPEAPVPALAASNANAEEFLRRHLSDAAAHQLVGAGDAPSIATTAPLDLAAYATTIARLPTRVGLPAIIAGESAALGTAEAPLISFADGDLTVSGQLTGTGVLVIRGTFHVSGAVVFSGLVLAMGGVVCEPGSSVTVMGAFWHAPGTDGRLQLRGRGALMYSSSALASVDGAFPELLPHAVVVAGWQEQW
jgi:hypothetical protein